MMLPRMSIYYRILAMALGIIALLSVAAGLIVWDSLDDIVSKQLQKRGAEIASHVALTSGNYILMEDLYNLYDLAKQTAANSEDVRYILIIDSNNRLLAHTFSGGIPQGLLVDRVNDKPQETAIFSSNEGIIHDIVVPIENGAVGYVRVGMTEEYTRNSVNQHIREIVLTIFGVCTLAVFLSSRISAIITKPIRNLAQVAESITQGNLEIRANIRDGGEVGRLAGAFNEMAASLIKASGDKEILLDELRAKEQMRDTLITRLMTAQEDERKRISRELHDETSQALTSLMLTMRVLAEDAPNQEQKDALLLGRDVAANILREVRDLAIELRPPVLDDLGLAAAIERYSDKFASRHGLDIDLQTAGRQIAVDDQIAVALYRIVQESLNNVVKHSGATTVSIVITFQPEQITVTIADNGRGISDADLLRAQQENRLGLYGMRERVELLQGRLEIRPSLQGGTELCITIPQYHPEKGESS
ncbi:HAMP domain-containing sensor histidine kinase [Anaerospora hongkongensis]|uniref:HAMP domain-containing sensor histidine kinase n=1 Tax=Anaerospora hongkongensis TaxID=244830 RepID=UPI00289FAE3C|nr:ATP-binding protein [Anaerospora hongkongensis]